MQKKNMFVAAGAAIAVVAVLLALNFFAPTAMLGRQTPGYQAVLLDNNQVYYGQLTGLGTAYPVLTNVFYVQAVVNPQTKQQSNILLKRGKEWHGPDKMLLNASHIVMVEPVTSGSTVASLINQANK